VVLVVLAALVQQARKEIAEMLAGQPVLVLMHLFLAGWVVVGVKVERRLV
jgi:hypothetical protein